MYFPKRKYQISNRHCAMLIIITGKYIVQIARFDPAKGIPTVIDSYAEFRKHAESSGIEDPPQLVMYVSILPCGQSNLINVKLALETRLLMIQMALLYTTKLLIKLKWTIHISQRTSV